jgi:hypothetical protein
MSERFSKNSLTLNFVFLDVSSELGIVSNAKRAWEISTKTNEHVNNVI